MSSFEYLRDIKNDLAQHINVRTVDNAKYQIEVVVGDSGFEAGSREVVKKIINDVHDLGRSDIVITQIDDIEYKDNHAVVIVKGPKGESVTYKNITVQDTSKVFENIV